MPFAPFPPSTYECHKSSKATPASVLELRVWYYIKNCTIIPRGIIVSVSVGYGYNIGNRTNTQMLSACVLETERYFPINWIIGSEQPLLRPLERPHVSACATGTIDTRHIQEQSHPTVVHSSKAKPTAVALQTTGPLLLLQIPGMLQQLPA